MVYEKLRTHLWILENGKEWHWSDLAKGLNTKVIEIDPNRLSRPLSNILEVIDAKFRANLWDYICPHPCMSLQWPILFIALPIFLYRFFRNIDCHAVIAIAGTGLYMTSSGYLSPLVMLSHPAKSMVNFFSILCLYTFTKLYRTVKTKNTSIKDVPHFWPILISCLCWALITFFFDETGVFLFIILGFVAYPLFSRLKEKILLACSFFTLPVAYMLIIKFLLPWLHWVVNHEVIDLKHYRDYPHITSLFFPNLQNLITNAYLLFSVHPGLKWDFSHFKGHPFLNFLQWSYTLAFIVTIGSLVYTIIKTKKLSARLKQILAGVLLLILFTYFHTFQLSHNVFVWTIFWYGCLFSLIYYVTLTMVLQLIWEENKANIFKILLPLIVLIFAAHGLMTSTYLIRIFHSQGDDARDYYYPHILSGETNIYDYFDLSKSMQISRCRHEYTLLYWSHVKNKPNPPLSVYKDLEPCKSILSADPFFNADSFYFVIEASFEFPPGRSFLNDPDYVASWIKMAGEPP